MTAGDAATTDFGNVFGARLIERRAAQRPAAHRREPPAKEHRPAMTVERFASGAAAELDGVAAAKDGGVAAALVIGLAALEAIVRALPLFARRNVLQQAKVDIRGAADDPHPNGVVTVQNGWLWLPIVILLELGSLALFIYSMAVIDRLGHPDWLLFIAGFLGIILAVFLMPGFFTLQPNEARVLILFGKYRGTVRASGTGTSGVTTTITLTAITPGRYLLIKQLGSSLSWWSVAELEMNCSD